MASKTIHGRPRGAYVYQISIDGFPRYIGKGRNGRAQAHISEAHRINRLRAAGEKIKTTRFYNGLAAALKRGADVAWSVISDGLTDAEAYELERVLIDRSRDGLWNVLRGGVGGDPNFFREFWRNPENVEKARKLGRSIWSRPGFRERLAQALKAWHSSPEFKRIRSEDMKLRFSDPMYKARHAEITRERWRKDRKTIEANLQRGRLAARQAFSAATRKLWNDPAYRERLCKAQKARWTPEARKQRSDLMKSRCSDPEFRASQSKKSKEVWSDPVARERMIAARWPKNT